MDEIPSHTCTKKELGLGKEGLSAGSFYDYGESNKAYIEIYQKKFRCLDKDLLAISGDFNSAAARLLLLRLERCRESETLKCKSDDEITEFFRDKWLFLLFNER